MLSFMLFFRVAYFSIFFVVFFRGVDMFLRFILRSPYILHKLLKTQLGLSGTWYKAEETRTAQIKLHCQAAK